MIIKPTIYEAHPPGEFWAKILRVDQTTSIFDNSPQLEILSATRKINGEGPERSLRYWTSLKLSRGSKLGKLYLALTGLQQIDPALEFDTKDLVGGEGIVSVKQSSKDNGDLTASITSWRCMP